MDVSILDQDIQVIINADDEVVATIFQNNFIGQSAIQFDDEGIALGTVGTVTEVDFTGTGVTGSRTGAKVTYSIPGGAAWLLASGGTLTGANTITSNFANGLVFNGAWATTTEKSHFAITPTLTATSGSPIINAVLINPTFVGTGTFYPLRVQSGGVDRLTVNSNGDVKVKNDIIGERYNVKAYGAYGDGQVVLDGVRTIGSPILTSATAVFVAGDVGKIILVSGNGTTGATWKTTILSYQSATQVTLSTNAPDSKSGCIVLWGHDDTTYIQSAINAANTAGGGIVFGPVGIYLIDGALQTSVVDGQNPNSQLYIPQTIGNTRTSVTIEGEATNQYVQARTGVMSYKGTIFWSTIQSVSGTNPAVIGGRNLTISSGTYQGFNDAYFRNFGVMVWSNKSASAPVISGINAFSIGKVSFDRVSVNTDYLALDCANPSAGTTFGIFVGSYADNGPNIISECSVSGFKSAMILGEHTNVNGGYIGQCYYALVMLRNTHQVHGWISVDRCVYQIFIPNGVFNDAPIGPSKCFIDFNLEFESQVTGRWYDTQYLVSDAGNVGRGVLRVDNPGAVPNSSVTDLTIIPLEYGPLPTRYSMGKGGLPTRTFAGFNHVDSQLELWANTNASAQDGLAGLSFSGSSAYTGSHIGGIQVSNRDASVEIFYEFYKTGISNNSGRKELYAALSGVAKLLLIHDAQQFALSNSIFYLSQFANDAAADAAAVGGSASDGAEYYDTTLKQKKVKENATWVALASLAGTETLTNKTITALKLTAGTAVAGTAPLQWASGTLLTVAAAGMGEYNNSFYQTKNSTLRYGLGGEIFDSTTDAGNGTTVETDLHSYTTPTSTLATDKEKVCAEYAGIFVGSTSSKQLRCYFAGTLIYDSTAIGIALATDWTVSVTVIRESSTVVKCTTKLTTTAASNLVYTQYTRLTGLTLSNTNIIKITGTASGAGAATNDIVLKVADGYWKPVAAN